MILLQRYLIPFRYNQSRKVEKKGIKIGYDGSSKSRKSMFANFEIVPFIKQ
jgi:hypothetical protein